MASKTSSGLSSPAGVARTEAALAGLFEDDSASAAPAPAPKTSIKPSSGSSDVAASALAAMASPARSAKEASPPHSKPASGASSKAPSSASSKHGSPERPKLSDSIKAMSPKDRAAFLSTLAMAEKVDKEENGDLDEEDEEDEEDEQDEEDEEDEEEEEEEDEEPKHAPSEIKTFAAATGEWLCGCAPSLSPPSLTHPSSSTLYHLHAVDIKDEVYKNVQKEIVRKGLEFKKNGKEFMLLVAKHAVALGVNMWQGGAGKGQGRPPNMDNLSKVWILWRAYQKNGTVASPNRKPSAKAKAPIVKVEKKLAKKLPPKVKPVVEDDIEDEESEGPPELVEDEDDIEEDTVAEAPKPEAKQGKKRPMEEGASAAAAAPSKRQAIQGKFVDHFKQMIHCANKLGAPLSKDAVKAVQSVMDFTSRLS